MQIKKDKRKILRMLQTEKKEYKLSWGKGGNKKWDLHEFIVSMISSGSSVEEETTNILKP